VLALAPGPLLTDNQGRFNEGRGTAVFRSASGAVKSPCPAAESSPLMGIQSADPDASRNRYLPCSWMFLHGQGAVPRDPAPVRLGFDASADLRQSRAERLAPRSCLFFPASPIGAVLQGTPEFEEGYSQRPVGTRMCTRAGPPVVVHTLWRYAGSCTDEPRQWPMVWS